MSDSIFSTESSAVLTWQFPGGSVDYYVIEYVLAQDSGGFASGNATIKTSNGSQTSVTIGNLSSGAIYKFRVAVVNSRGTSQFSECGVFQTLGKCLNSPFFLLFTIWQALSVKILCFYVSLQPLVFQQTQPAWYVSAQLLLLYCQHF